MGKFVMSITEEDQTLSAMAQQLSIKKAEVVQLALNFLHHTLELRQQGIHITTSKEVNKTKDILTEASAGSVAFKLHGD